MQSLCKLEVSTFVWEATAILSYANSSSIYSRNCHADIICQCSDIFVQRPHLHAQKL
jgi:hypothetical protein